MADRRRRRNREESARETCRVTGCGQVTSDKKPYCVDHIDRLPYVAQVRDELARREAETLAAATRRGWRGIDTTTGAAREIVHELAVKGAQTPGRLAKSVELNMDQVEGYVSALERAGIAKLVRTKRRRGGERKVVELVKKTA